MKRRSDGILAGLVTALAIILLAGLWQQIVSPPLADGAARRITGCGALAANSVPRRACIVRQVFQGEGRAAVAVAWCESRLDPAARNGQYRGILQLGANERARYGHGRTVLAQARAGKRLFDDRGWQPWACKP